MDITTPGLDNPNDDVPDGWTDTGELEWERDDGALLRIHSTLPTRSAEEFNSATHSQASGSFEILFHERPLPSTPEQIDRVGTRTAARAKAIAAMAERR